MSLRILWLTRTAQFLGGAEHYIAQVAASIEELGFHNSLFYRAGTWIDPTFVRVFAQSFPLLDFQSQVRDAAPDLIFLHQPPNDDVWRQLIHANVPVAHFVHDHSLFCLRRYKYTSIGHRTCRKTTSRRACYPCIGFVERRRDGGLPITFRRLGPLLEKQSAYQTFPAIITGSRYMRDHVCAHGFLPERVHHIPMFVRRPGSSPLTARSSDSMLFVGALIRGKGLDLLLRALTELPSGIKLVVVGEGHQADTYHRLTESLGLSARVKFHGKMEPSSLSLMYRKATAVVVPSREPETFGLVGPEALLHGTPVVASDVGGTSDWLRHGQTGLSFKSGSVTGLAAAIRAVLERPEDALEMAETGREFCAENFVRELHISRLTSLFEWLTER